ncbi:MAG: chloride channel protein [Clostridia bacterium]|nr:chloride channel protein [Clostridia bacterium]
MNMHKMRAVPEYIKAFVKWIILAGIVGCIGGAVGSVFHICIDLATELRMEHSWILYLLPIGGLVIAGLYALGKNYGRIDTNRVLEAVYSSEKVPFVMAPLIFISTVMTHLLGGSAGREGAALQLGGSIGYRIGKTFRLKPGDMHLIVMAGMSAVFSALFGTPLTAAVFAIEVVCVGVWHYAALVPCLTGALAGFGMAQCFGLAPVHFGGVVFPALTVGAAGQVAILALLCALVGMLFYETIHAAEHLGERYLPNKFLRAAVGGAIVVVLTLLVGTRDYNGAGMDIITRAIGGEARYEAFLLKILFTAVTIAAGFKGGEIVPAFFIGSTFGCVAAPLLGLDPGFAAAVGFVAVFCSVVNCPVASMFLALEVFGAEGMLFFAVACAVSFMMSGRSSLYKAQKMVYSKTDETRIDPTVE